MASKPNVLFVCVHNAGRSQMAQAFLAHLAGGKITVSSGGTDPAAIVNPAAVEAMLEVGIDISGQTPRAISAADVEQATMVITMGCGDACPYFPGIDYRNWQLTDPAGQTLDAVRAIRDEIRVQVEQLITELTG